MKSITSYCRIALGMALLIVAPINASAQNYPNKTIRVIAPYPPGAVDLMGRYICEKFSQSMGQPCIVENKPGAGGLIGIEYVAKAAPDGYTLLIAPNSLVILPSLHPKAPYDTSKDFAPIALVSSTPVMIGTHPSFPARTFNEFLSYVKANPGKVNFTSCGLASPQHLGGELLKSMAGLDMQHILYKGCGPAEADVLAGQVPVIISNLARFLPQIKVGKLRGYAVTGAQRSQFAPDVPTVQELGFPGYDVDVWFGLLAPAGTPKEVVGRLNSEVNRTLAQQDVKARLLAQFYEPIGGTSEQFADVIRKDTARYGKIIRDSGIRAE